MIANFTNQTGIPIEIDESALQSRPAALRRTVTAAFPEMALGSFFALILEVDRLIALEDGKRLLITEDRKADNVTARYEFRLGRYGLSARQTTAIDAIIQKHIAESESNSQFKIKRGVLSLTSNQRFRDEVETLLAQLGSAMARSEKFFTWQARRNAGIRQKLSATSREKLTSPSFDGLVRAFSKRYELPVWIDYVGIQKAGISLAQPVQDGGEFQLSGRGFGPGSQTPRTRLASGARSHSDLDSKESC